ncbi:Glycerol-3-phosphate dehydrogenase SDP6 [Picochlorum sp. SENEW3]|nr:Glycerol-3-phosphate dehydrogenase SDP6 [Picochlorum sp. SENEW3]
MWQHKGFRSIAGVSVVGVGVVVGTQLNSGEKGVSTPMIQQSLAYSNAHQNSQLVKLPHWKSAEPLPKRDLVWKQLQARSKSRREYDVLVIGGGATGTGCALDAQTRGLETLLVEKEDFAAGTSSRSTKLVHGGVRYLEKAFKNFDYGQLKLVFEALHERKTVLDSAPHLAIPLPIMTPCYAWWEVPYYWAGLKAYDLVAGSKNLSWSHYLSPTKSRASFPTLSDANASSKHLKGTIVYYDGQFNDSRLAVAVACTAQAAGATVMNHAEVIKLIHEDGRVVGAHVRDTITGKVTKVYAKTVINATGPFTDDIRRMSDPNAKSMIMPSAGVHITLPDYYSPENVGMIVPKTKDGRVVFMLPWLGETIAGTTDSSSTVTMRPQATEEDIQFILDALSEYLTVKVRRSDVKSAWSGIRPLALDPKETDTSNALRDHIVTIGDDGVITITGGKWTTYRLMAQDAVDAVVKEKDFDPKPCVTDKLKLVGAEGWSRALFTEVAQNYTVPHRPGAIDTRVAKYLAASYGDRAHIITKIAEDNALGKRLVRGYPVLEAEVLYTMRYEMCETPEDFIARRTRLIFLDTRATLEALPRIVELMGMERRWGSRRKRQELNRAIEFVHTFEASSSA